MSIYDSLNPEQQKAVRHEEGPLLILAGAGSGKTRVLTHRVAWLIEERGVDPWNILAITFTNKAASEMRERVRAILSRPEAGDGILSDAVWVSTFHSMCVRILRRYIDRIGYGTNFSIYDADDQKVVIREVCKRMNIDTKRIPERYFLNRISAEKDELIPPEDYAGIFREDVNSVGHQLSAVYTEYQETLHRNNALDFDDLISKCVELFTACPEVLDSYQERFRYILVDEYQDTNTAQFRLVSQLASKYRNLCVVGDDDQSIYRFRGANIGNILNFEKVFPDAEVIRLEQNYRSTKTILKAANHVISRNKGRKEKSLWTENDEGGKIHFRQFDNAFGEAEFVADEIEKSVQMGASYQDFAVLYRTNAQSRLFEEKFLLKNIPYELVGGVKFYERREIKDVLAYLKTIANARDDVAALRIINVPRRGIGATTIARVQNYAAEKGLGFYEALCLAPEIPGIGRSQKKLEEFVRMIQNFRESARTSSVQELIGEVVQESGYAEDLKKEHDPGDLERLENIDELLNTAASYEENAEEPTLSGFLEEVALVADPDEVSENADRVLLMTLHSAKGLEFPTVFLVGLEEGMFPGLKSISSDDSTEIEEERRLCYVGITRAQRELYLTAARERMVHGEKGQYEISRFVEDIPEDLLEFGYGETDWYSPRRPERRQAGKRNRIASRQASKAFAGNVYAPRQFEVKKADALSYTIGDRVAHSKFGEGTVTAITEGGRDYEVTVAFDRAGTRKLFASFANLEKIS